MVTSPASELTSTVLETLESVTVTGPLINCHGRALLDGIFSRFWRGTCFIARVVQETSA